MCSPGAIARWRPRAAARVRSRWALGARELGSEVDHARLARAVGTGELGDSVAVGEHELRGAEAARDRLGTGRVASGGVQHVAAVHRDDQRRVHTCTAHGVGGRYRVVGVDESNANERCRRRSASASAGAAHAPQDCVGALARRGRRTGHRRSAARRASVRAARASARRARRRHPAGPAASEDRGGTRRCSTSTRTSAPAARAASAWRCAQMPSTGSRRLG